MFSIIYIYINKKEKKEKKEKKRERKREKEREKSEKRDKKETKRDKKGKKEKKRKKREKEREKRKREKKKERKMLLIKMDNLHGDLKPISHKEFNEFIKGKGFKGRNEHSLKDLMVKFGFKPMYDRRALTISSEDMDPTTFNSLRQAASSTGISYGVPIYAKNKERNFIKKDEKIYNINWHN